MRRDKVGNGKILKRTVAAGLLALLVMGTAACGKKEQVETAVGPEYVYVPEYIEMKDMADARFYNSVIAGDAMYFLSYSYDEEAMTSVDQLCRYEPFAENSLTVLPVKLEGNRNVMCFYVDKEENIYLCTIDYSSDETDANGMMVGKMLLTKYDVQGNLVFEQDISQVINENQENSYVNGIAVDDKGRCYLHSSDMVFLFDTEGNNSGAIDNNDNWISNMGKGKDGKMYASYYDSTSASPGMVLAEVDFDGRKMGQTYGNFPSGNGGDALIAGNEKDFLVHNGSKLMEYDLASQTTSDVLTWLDSDINGQNVEGYGALSDGRYLAVVSDWNTRETEIILLTRTKSSELVQKEQLSVGTLYTNQSLQAAAVAFNKSSDKYRINIKTYMDTNNWTETSYQDAITNLNNDITSGSNAPDILDLSQLNVEQLAAKGVFEDLTPYLQNSEVLDADDFIANILDSFRFNDKLISIPSSFSLRTMIGKSADVGDEMGWTLEELIAYADSNEGAQLFDGASKGYIINMCLTYNMDDFVNWETGECNFDSQEFKDLLEFVNRFPDEIDWQSDTRSQPAKIAAGEVLLADAYIGDINSIQEYIAMFNKEPVTFIGYPTMDGSVGCSLQVNEVYGIASKSGNKEGAWAFIEHYLASQNTGSMFFYGLPSRQSQFDEMIEKATKVDYVLDENGDPLLDEAGNPITEMGMSSISYGDWEYTYHTPTEEEAEILKKLISVATTSPGSDEQISVIIAEEAEGYFQGQKFVDAVAEVIQSRAQVYVSENS